MLFPNNKTLTTRSAGLKFNRRSGLISLGGLFLMGYWGLHHNKKKSLILRFEVVSGEFKNLPPALLSRLQSTGFLQRLDESDWLNAYEILHRENLIAELAQVDRLFVNELTRNLADVHQLISSMPFQSRELLYSAYGTLFFYFDDAVTQDYLGSLTDPVSRKMAVDSLKQSSVNADTWRSLERYQEYCRLADYFKSLECRNTRFQQGVPTALSPNARIFLCQGHNNALFFWIKGLLDDAFGDDVKKEFVSGQARPEITLVHFDSHGDIYDASLQQSLYMLFSLKELNVSDNRRVEKALDDLAAGVQDISIDSFIVPAAIAGIIGGIYWVVPRLDKNYVDCILRTYSGRVKVVRNARNAVTHMTINVLDYNTDNVRRKMSVTVVDAAGLPHLKDRSTILDIDEDYFGARHPKGQPDLIQFYPDDDVFEELMEEAMRAVRQKLRPSLVTIAQSPEFTFKGRERGITERLLQTLQK